MSKHPVREKRGWTRAVALVLLCILMAALLATRMTHGCARRHRTGFPALSSAPAATMQSGAVQAASAPAVDQGQDVAALHARDELLLNHFSWANPEHTKVRIPIEHAMELLAQRGLPVQQNAPASAPMTGDRSLRVTEPLTKGHAPTAYEQEQTR